MKQLKFVDSIDGVKADALVVLGQEVLVDKSLQKMLQHNIGLFKSSFWMTTNGAFPVPKIGRVVLQEELLPFVVDENVIVVVPEESVLEIAFFLLKKKSPSQVLYFFTKKPREREKEFEPFFHIHQGITLAKEITSAPANLMPPSEVAARCNLLKKEGLEVTVLDCTELKKIGANAITAVGKGSSNPPCMVVLEWKGSKEAPIALIGKGVCFDAGGIHLKKTHLLEMKFDKAGAGVVMGVMSIIAKLKLPIHVVGVIPLVENMPDGNSLKPGDMITTLGGKTVEIVDTDCEGRLILADAIAFVQNQFAPSQLIDFATLAIETFGALGSEYAGLFSNDDALANELIQRGLETNEKLWRLPLGPYYAKQTASKIADLKNCGMDGYGGSSAAAEFLRAFIKPGLPWAHIDMAGTAWKQDALDEGVTGFGVELMAQFFRQKIRELQVRNEHQLT